MNKKSRPVALGFLFLSAFCALAPAGENPALPETGGDDAVRSVLLNVDVFLANPEFRNELLKYSGEHSINFAEPRNHRFSALFKNSDALNEMLEKAETDGRIELFTNPRIPNLNVDKVGTKSNRRKSVGRPFYTFSFDQETRDALGDIDLQTIKLSSGERPFFERTTSGVNCEIFSILNPDCLSATVGISHRWSMPHSILQNTVTFPVGENRMDCEARQTVVSSLETKLVTQIPHNHTLLVTDVNHLYEDELAYPLAVGDSFSFFTIRVRIFDETNPMDRAELARIRETNEFLK